MAPEDNISGQNSARVGAVASLWRYPVKSMQGEEVGSAALTERGLAGDRAYAIRDRETGHIASAKHPRKWRSLLACRAAFVEPPHPARPTPPVWITLPDGSRICSVDSDVDAMLTRVLGRDVTLALEAPETSRREADRTPLDSGDGLVIRDEVMGLASPPGTFFDYAPIHLLTTATLRRLSLLYPESRFDVSRFRPNIVVTPRDNAPDFPENSWLGHSLIVGVDTRLTLIDPTPRCVVTTLAQSALAHDPGILRAVTRHNAAASVTLAPGVVMQAVAGVYAQVIEPGVLYVGDTVWLS